MHFEYICEAVTQGIMRLGLDTGVPVIFGVLACLTEEQARERAGLVAGKHNHGTEWAQSALAMAALSLWHPRRRPGVDHDDGLRMPNAGELRPGQPGRDGLTVAPLV